MSFDISKVKTYSDEELKRIDDFCSANNIKQIGREFYFTLNNQKYRFSYNLIGLTDSETRSLIRRKADTCNIITIRARKGDLIWIYECLRDGKPLKRPKKVEVPSPTPVTPPPQTEVIEKPKQEVKKDKKKEAMNALLKKGRW